MAPRLATCFFNGCTRPVVRGSDCIVCKLHYCAKHQAVSHSSCPSVAELDEEVWKKLMDDEVSALLKQINITELVKVATALNKGEHCTFRTNKHTGDDSMMGCANYHASILFDSGEGWLVRVPRTSGSPLPASSVEYLVSSEYATLKFLESTKVPAPKAFGYGLVSDALNKVGVNFLLMERLPGKPYQEYMANKLQKQLVLQQLSHILIEINRHPFDKVGSLLLEKGKVHVSAVASNRFGTLDQYGPFNSAVEYFSKIADHYLELIVDEASLQFFLKHVDDKGDHILVDENYNITGAIDWQFARVVPACEAFGPSLVTADLNALYTGQAGSTNMDRLLALAFQEQGEHTLAEYAGGSDFLRRFHFGLASGLEREEIRQMLLGLIVSLGAPSETDIEDWMSKEAIRYSDDPQWLKIDVLQLEKKNLSPKIL